MSKPTVLLLTTANPTTIIAEWPYYQNWTLPSTLASHGFTVSILSWQDQILDVQTLATYNIITFLWCNDYHKHGPALSAFINNIVIPAQALNPSLRVCNDSRIILWNMDKEVYLRDLLAAGFLIPHTEILPSIYGPGAHGTLLNAVSSHGTNAVVLKPSISGSSKGTYLVRNPSQLSAADTACLNAIIREGVDGSLLLQSYEPAISRGEYSLVFINGKHTHTILKTPAKGEFRCQGEFGGGVAEIPREDVPEDAVRVAHKAMAYMRARFHGCVEGTSSAIAPLPRLTTTITSDSKMPKKRIRFFPSLWRLGNLLSVLRRRQVIASPSATSSSSSSSPSFPPSSASTPSTSPSTPPFSTLSPSSITRSTSQNFPNPLLYARIDGILRPNNTFVLMEIEAIEPHLWLETSVTPGVKEAFYSALLGGDEEKEKGNEKDGSE